MKVTYWRPYESQPHITSDLGEASKLVQARQATLESVEHEKPGKRIIVQMTYLNDIGGIETAMANMSAAFPDANFCFVINSHASNAEAQILRLAQRHDVLIDRNTKQYNGDIAFIFTPIMQSVPFERINCPVVYQFIHSDIGKLTEMEQWHDFNWKPNAKVTKVISVSETARDSLKNALGVDSEVLANILAEPSERPVFLCLSRATPEKGIDRLIKMVQAFDRAGKDYVLYLCSTLDPYGNYYRELKNSAHVVLVEPNPYNDSLMRCADYLVQLSSCESYCFSVHQATAQPRIRALLTKRRRARMSQMLVRIDEEIDKELTYIHDNMGVVNLNQFAVMSGIVRRIYKQWKPNHEATLKLREEARKNVAQK